MATIAEQLTSLANTKTAIKQAIVDKGVAVADDTPFSGYAAKIGEISGGGAPATKYGLTLDDVLGDVDSNGVLQGPTGQIAANFAGVKSVGEMALAYKFFNASVTTAVFNDLTSVSKNSFLYAFAATLATSNNLPEVTFECNNLEEVTVPLAFSHLFDGRTNAKAYFRNLKKIAAQDVFNYLSPNKVVVPDETFPALEEISGIGTLASFSKIESTGTTFTFSKVKKIEGNSQFFAPFSAMNGNGQVWKFPSATELTKYVWNNTSTTGEIHLAAANQAALEACDGYEYKWGFQKADIYFDL